jgi:AcrR family transcriptional regulator
VVRHSDSRVRTVRAAARLIGDRGVAGTGLREIVIAAGTPWGSLSHHFPGGKDELVIDAVLWSATRFADHLRRALTDAPPPTLPDLLRSSVRWWSHALVAVEFSGGCTVAATAMDASLAHSDVRDAVGRAFQSWIEPITAIAAIDGVAPPLDHQFAVTTVAALEGAVLLARVKRSVAPLEAIETCLLQLADAMRSPSVAGR